LMVSAFYWIVPEWLVGMDFDIHSAKNVEICQLAKQFFAVCAIFEILEGARISLFGALRAFRDTRYTLLVSLATFWGVALPIGYFLSTLPSLKGVGMWWGMVAGASISFLLLYHRLASRLNRIT